MLGSSTRNSSYISFQYPLAESPRLSARGLRDPSSLDAPHLFRTSGDGIRREQSVTVDRIFRCVDVVVAREGSLSRTGYVTGTRRNHSLCIEYLTPTLPVLPLQLR